MSKYGRKGKRPEGFEYIEGVLDALDQEMREKVNESHEGKRKVESQQPIMQINWQRSRYVYDMYWRYGKISKEVYDYCIRNKLVDGPLMAKWRKPGYERLCSTYVINPRNYNFGTVSICRVPRHALGQDENIECPTTGCRGCASGSGIRNLFGNKYGQYLASIQIKREEQRKEQHTRNNKRPLEDESSPHVWAADDEDDDKAHDEEEKAGAKKPRRLESEEEEVIIAVPHAQNQVSPDLDGSSDVRN